MTIKKARWKRGKTKKKKEHKLCYQPLCFSKFTLKEGIRNNAVTQEKEFQRRKQQGASSRLLRPWGEECWRHHGLRQAQTIMH